MADTVFVFGETTIPSAWCNEVNRVVHKIFKGPTYTGQLFKIDTYGGIHMGKDVATGVDVLFLESAFDGQHAHVAYGAGAAVDAYLSLRGESTGDGKAFIELNTNNLISQPTFLMQRNEGVNGDLFFKQAGTGNFAIDLIDSGQLLFQNAGFTVAGIDASGNFFIGEPSNTFAAFHMDDGASGATGVPANTQMVIESNSDAYMAFLSPTVGGYRQGIFFQNTNTISGYMIYDIDAGRLEFGAADATKALLQSTGTLQVSDNAVFSTHAAGTMLAAEADGNAYLTLFDSSSLSLYETGIIFGHTGVTTSGKIAYDSSDSKFLFRINNVADQIVFSDGPGGRIGIGVLAPESALQIENTNPVQITLDGGLASAIQFKDAGNNLPTQSIDFGDFASSLRGRLLYNHSANLMGFIVETIETMRLDANATAGNTRLLIYDVDNATLERVTVGVADSGGAGFKVLRIPN